LNPDPGIGASAWLVAMDSHHLLLDAGTHPALEGNASLPRYRDARGIELDAIVVSHCHHDHVGSLPVAVRQFPHANVYLTELSYFLVERVLHNSVNVMMRQRTELGVREYPLYTHEEVDEIAPVFQGIGYRREIEWAPFARQKAAHRKGPTLEFFDAGHTLGSAGVLVRGRRQTLFYTGDVCFHDQTLLRRADFDGVRADVLLMETTRGTTATPRNFRRSAEVQRFMSAIQRVLARKGNVLIPAFALGRTQEILAELALLMRTGKLKRQPVYIGGLGRVFTELYDLEARRTRRHHPQLKLTEALDLQVVSPDQVNAMSLSGGRLFVLTAGMMSENTAAHDLALRLMKEPRNAILFVGYAAEDSPAGRLRAAAPGKPFLFSPAAGQASYRCEIDSFDLTAHAQREDLLDLVTRVEPRAVILGHGDPEAQDWFKDQIRHRYPKMKILTPRPGDVMEA
jgi:Cft2 family RNA processing exonuclease